MPSVLTSSASLSEVIFYSLPYSWWRCFQSLLVRGFSDPQQYNWGGVGTTGWEWALFQACTRYLRTNASKYPHLQPQPHLPPAKICLCSLVNSKIDGFEYKSVRRWVDVQVFPVPALAVSSQIKRMSVKVVRWKKHLTSSHICWEIYGQRREISWGGWIIQGQERGRLTSEGRS